VRVIRNFYVAFIFLYSLTNFMFIVDIISVSLILFNYNPASEKHSK
jgi:accessory gene regulator protein AgrB